MYAILGALALNNVAAAADDYYRTWGTCYIYANGKLATSFESTQARCDQYLRELVSAAPNGGWQAQWRAVRGS